MYSVMLNFDGRLESVTFPSRIQAIRYIFVFCDNDFSELYGIYHSVDGNVINITTDFLKFCGVVA